jgi:hypothetical protein
VQRFGSEAWQTQQKAVIREAGVRAMIPGLRERLEYQFYADVFRRLTVRERMFVMAMADMDGPITLSTVAQKIGVPSRKIGSIEQALLTKEVILESLDGTIEFRTPLSDRYLRSRRSNYETADVNAYRASLQAQFAKPREIKET